MKRMLSVAFAMICFATASYSQGWFRQPTPHATLRSTVVLPDNSVIFQIYAPKAEIVSLTGDLPWDKPVQFMKMENGVWKGRLSAMEDGKLYTITDFIKSVPECAELTNQKVSALVRQMMPDLIEKIEEKRKSYFRKVEA